MARPVLILRRGIVADAHVTFVGVELLTTRTATVTGAKGTLTGGSAGSTIKLGTATKAKATLTTTGPFQWGTSTSAKATLTVTAPPTKFGTATRAKATLTVTP